MVLNRIWHLGTVVIINRNTVDTAEQQQVCLVARPVAFAHAELSFNACFTVELVLRMFASGGVKAYLTKAWNIFDLAMVLAGYTQFLPTSITGE